MASGFGGKGTAQDWIPAALNVTRLAAICSVVEREKARASVKDKKGEREMEGKKNRNAVQAWS